MIQKGLTSAIIIVIVLVVAAVGYFGLKKLAQKGIMPLPGYLPNFFEPISSGSWKTYRDEQFGFEVGYPAYFKHSPVSSGDTIVESYGEFSVSSDRSDHLYLAVHTRPLGGFEYLNQEGGYGFRYNAQDKLWKANMSGTPNSYAPQKFTIKDSSLVYYLVRTGDTATVKELIFIENPRHNLFIELILSRNNSYQDCITPCPEEKPYSDENTLNQILSTFKFIK